MLDRRMFVRAAGLSAILLQGAVAPPGVPGPGAPPTLQRPLATSAWVNFEFAVTWERMNTLQELMTNLVDRKIGDVTLMISSVGGDLAAALSTYNFLRSLGIRLTTYNVGNVYSAAVMLYLAGERRVVEPTGQFLIHEPSTGGTIGSLTEAQLGDRVESLRLDTGRFEDLLLARTRIAKGTLETIMAKTTFVDPHKAIDMGIATEIAHLVRPPSTPLITMSQSTLHGPAPGAPAVSAPQ